MEQLEDSTGTSGKPQYEVIIHFKKDLYYGSTSEPGCTSCLRIVSYRSTNTKTEIIKQLYGFGGGRGGVWAADETVWVPCDTFSHIEFKKGRW